MSDIALIWNPLEGAADLGIEDNDLASDPTFETAIFLSLFTNRRVQPGDDVPIELGADRGGWWADQLSPIAGDLFGSRLWLLKRVKELPIVLSRGREYSIEALEWMRLDKITDKLTVTSEIYAPGVLLLTPTIYQPKRDPVSFKYAYNWQAQLARRV